MDSSLLIPDARVLDQAWERFGAGVELACHPFRNFTLATTDGSGLPQARLMTLRGVERDAGRLWLHSHQHSAKVMEITSNPAFAATFFDPEHMVSIRVRGTAACHLFDSAALAEFSRGAVAAGRGNAADLLWPGSPDALQHAITRKAFREFVAIALTVDELVWMQIAGGKVRHVRFREREGWQCEAMVD